MKKINITPSITPRGSGALTAYLKEIGNIPLLEPEEEVRLAQRIKQGDQNARKELINANLRFVISTAKQYQNRGLSLEDLISEGNIWLIKAANTFDETKGLRFISYAAPFIINKILSALLEKGSIIPIPSHRPKIKQEIEKIIRDLLYTLGYEPSPEQILEAMKMQGRKGMNTQKIGKILNIFSKHYSLDDSEEGNEKYTLPSTAWWEEQDTDNTEADNRKKVKKLLQWLKKKEKMIMALRYGLLWCLDTSEQEEMTKEYGIKTDTLIKTDANGEIEYKKMAVSDIAKYLKVTDGAIYNKIKRIIKKLSLEQVDGRNQKSTSTIKKIDGRKRKKWQ